MTYTGNRSLSNSFFFNVSLSSLIRPTYVRFCCSYRCFAVTFLPLWYLVFTSHGTFKLMVSVSANIHLLCVRDAFVPFASRSHCTLAAQTNSHTFSLFHKNAKVCFPSCFAWYAYLIKCFVDALCMCRFESGGMYLCILYIYIDAVDDCWGIRIWKDESSALCLYLSLGTNKWENENLSIILTSLVLQHTHTSLYSNALKQRQNPHRYFHFESFAHTFILIYRLMCGSKP